MKRHLEFNRKTNIKWLWIGLALFSASLFFVKWDSSSARQGVVVGALALVVITIVIAFHWKKRLTIKELHERRRTYQKISTKYLLPFFVCAYLIYVFSAGQDFGLFIVGFASTLMTGGALLALVIAHNNKGMFQRDKI